MPIAYDEFAPEDGLPVMAGEKQVGTLGSTADRRGLALLQARSRRRCDGGRHTASAPAASQFAPVKPDWARFPFPGDTQRRAMKAVRTAILHDDGRHRCPWPGRDPLYVAYHDDEWGVPEYDDRALFEKLILDGFQAGLSWITILRKRDNFRRAFDEFDPEKIARYTPKKVERLMQDAGIIRNRAKIEGTVSSARACLEDHGKGPGFSDLLWDRLDGRPKHEQVQDDQAGPGRDRRVTRDLEGSRRARLQIRRADDRLCLHAGGRHGQRSSGDLPSSRGLRRSSRARDEESTRPHPQASLRAWQRMLSGRRLDLLDPSPLDVEIEDIAHGLARVARWNGQTSGAHIFSVAQHALLVEAFARAKVPRLDRSARLVVLLHDAPEYVVGDMISPFKAVIGDSYKAVEKRLLAAIHLRFGLPPKCRRKPAQPDQGGRPQRGLPRGDPARRLRNQRGPQVLRRPDAPFERAGARLSHAMAGRDRREAVPRTVRTLWR